MIHNVIWIFLNSAQNLLIYDMLDWTNYFIRKEKLMLNIKNKKKKIKEKRKGKKRKEKKTMFIYLFPN